MPDHGWKIGVCLFSLFASTEVVLMGPPFKLGVDLQRRRDLDLRGRPDEEARPDETLSTQEMDNLIAAVTRRVNPGGQKEVTIRKYGVEQIEIIVPEVDEAEVQRIERIISTTGRSRVPHPGEQARRQGPHRAGLGRSVEDADSRFQGRTAGLVGAGEGGRENAVSPTIRDICRRTWKPARARSRKSSSSKDILQRHRRLSHAGRAVGTDREGASPA